MKFESTSLAYMKPKIQWHVIKYNDLEYMAYAVPTEKQVKVSSELHSRNRQKFERVRGGERLIRSVLL